MVTNFDWPENLCSGPNVDMSPDYRQSAPVPSANRYLMEDKTIDAYFGFGMNDDTIWMRQQQSSADLAIQRDVRTGDDRPNPMAENIYLARQQGHGPGSLAPSLVASDRAQQFAAWIPEASWLLACPVRDFRTNSICAARHEFGTCVCFQADLLVILQKSLSRNYGSFCSPLKTPRGGRVARATGLKE
jgi:hypothetical protein